jgi:hypothetical protein
MEQDEKEVTGVRRKLHNEKLHNLYSSSIKHVRTIKSSKMMQEGHGTHKGDVRNTRCKDNIKMNFRKQGIDV